MGARSLKTVIRLYVVVYTMTTRLFANVSESSRASFPPLAATQKHRAKRLIDHGARHGTKTHLSILMLGKSLLVLLLGVHLEVHDISLVLSDAFVVTDQDFVGTLRNQSHVVRNHNHSTLKILQASRKSVNRLHIKRVGRLI